MLQTVSQKKFIFIAMQNTLIKNHNSLQFTTIAILFYTIKQKKKLEQLLKLSDRWL